MKHLFTYLLVLSIGLNIYFLVRKIERTKRDKEVMKLHYYKTITHKEGYDYFLGQMKSKYPETNIDQKYFVIFRWDSLHYDFMYRDQMKVLDSMAASFGKYKIEYVFATEMEEAPSKSFLKFYKDEYKNVKMLYGMDDFISGIYSLKNLKFSKPIITGKRGDKEKDKDDSHKFKQGSLYLILDSKGKVLHFNGKYFGILKDTAFLRKLNALIPDKELQILN